MKNKTIVASVGLVVLGAVSYILNEPSCMWGIIPLIWLVNDIRDEPKEE